VVSIKTAKTFCLSLQRLPARKICSAQFEIRVRRRSDGQLSFEFNDYLLIGFAPFGRSGDRKALFRAGM
jgi:hypothetical protein